MTPLSRPTLSPLFGSIPPPGIQKLNFDAKGSTTRPKGARKLATHAVSGRFVSDDQVALESKESLLFRDVKSLILRRLPE